MGSVNHKVVANIELKPELGIGNKNPNFQNVGYYMHITSQEPFNQLCNPILLLSVCGCDYLQVFGAAWNDVVCIDPLSIVIAKCT